MTLPKVQFIATGGTIGFLGEGRMDAVAYGEHGTPILIDELLARVPEINDVAEIHAEQPLVEGAPGQSIGPREWLALADRCNALLNGPNPPDGIVITHGTYVLEETAYFLNLTVHSDRPVVLTGAQRPSTTMSSDVDINLFNAVLAAGARESTGKGALVVFNHEINAARDVTKTSVFRAETFQSRDLGFLGYVDSDAKVVYYRAPTKRHTSQSEFQVSRDTELPWVDIIYTYAGDDGRAIEALVERGARGLIVTAGGPNPSFSRAVSRAIARGVVVVRANHMGSGRVVATPGMIQNGVVAADNLSPKKARILLMLALGVSEEREDLQRIFTEY